jgi:hypothetical protein
MAAARIEVRDRNAEVLRPFQADASDDLDIEKIRAWWNRDDYP